MHDDLVIWGSSGHALVVADIVRLLGKHRVCGFIDDTGSAGTAGKSSSIPLLGGRDCLPGLVEGGVSKMVVAVGDCRARLELAEVAAALGFSFPPAIHPSSVIAGDVRIGAGTVVAAGAVVNAGAWLGDHVIINTSSSVDHNCVVRDGVHLGPGVHLAGWVKVGRASWIGIGAVVKDRVQIGAGSVIGAGAVVLSNVPDDVLAVGCPAKVMSKGSRSPG